MPKNIKKVLRKKKARASTTLPMIAMLAALGVSSLTYSVTTVSADAGTSATKTTTIQMPKGKRGGERGQHGIGGTVTGITGTVITITGKDSKVYTIDASSAKFVKVTPPVQSTGTSSSLRPEPTFTTIALTDISVGNTIMVKGTISGTTVTATEVAVGTFSKSGPHDGSVKRIKPVAAGVIQSINGSIVTIKDRVGAVYTVDVSGAKILQGGRGLASTVVTVADIKVGDMLGAQGVLTGTNVVATEVMTGPQHPFMQRLNEKRMSGK